MLFWFSAAQLIAAKVDRLRVAEAQLLALAPRFGGVDVDCQIDVLDTPIPRSVIPLVSHKHDLVDPENIQDAEHYILHGIRVTSENQEDTQGTRKTAAPLVLLHGYMNGAAYFYRNLVGLSRAFSSVYSLDLIGWGLSSRPKFDLDLSHKQHDNKEEQRMRTAEDVFVESLEAWRRAQDIPTMILAGHSMGGYVGVAYAERYPQHVERLILLSPAGVPADSSPSTERITQRRQQSLVFRMISSTWMWLYDRNYTAGGILRTLPSGRAQKMMSSYVEKRLPAVTDPSEREALSEYLLANNILPGSGEYCVHSFLTSNLHGRKPTELRIPHLRVPSVSFLYGTRDWMDLDGGLQAQARCSSSSSSPDVSVYQVRDAGHLLMLDNWQEFNAGVMQAAGVRIPENSPEAELVFPSEEHHLAVTASVSNKTNELETDVVEGGVCAS